jgi:hypothetical protein
MAREIGNPRTSRTLRPKRIFLQYIRITYVLYQQLD